MFKKLKVLILSEFASRNDLDDRREAYRLVLESYATFLRSWLSAVEAGFAQTFYEDMHFASQECTKSLVLGNLGAKFLWTWLVPGSVIAWCPGRSRAATRPGI